MGEGKTSKNSRTSKKPVMMAVKREKPKKTEILIEVTQDAYNKILESKDLSTYDGKEILEIVTRYGKNYLRLKNN